MGSSLLRSYLQSLPEWTILVIDRAPAVCSQVTAPNVQSPVRQKENPRRLWQIGAGEDRAPRMPVRKYKSSKHLQPPRRVRSMDDDLVVLKTIAVASEQCPFVNSEENLNWMSPALAA
jgi:hypothetical protein